MSIIDRYVARHFLSGYVILLAVGMGLYIMTDLLANFDEFFENDELPTWRVLAFMGDFYLHNLPLYFAQLGAPLMAVAAAFTLGNLARNNELVALVAAGTPLQRLAAPLLVCAVLLIAVWVANKELLIPQIAHKIARHHDDIAGTRTEGVYFVRDEQGAILNAQHLDPRGGRLTRVQIIVPAAGGVRSRLIDADFAEYDAAAETWRLERGRLLDLREETDFNRPLRFDPIAEYPYTHGPEALVLYQRAGWTDMLSLRQMNALVRAGNLPNISAVMVNRHIRLTQPLLQLILLMLALPFFLVREPRSVLAAGGRALLLCGVFLGLTFVAHGIVSDTGAALRAWAPILCFGPLAVLQLANVKT